MFESRERLARDIRGLLGALREEGAGRYACLFDQSGILFEEAEEGGPPSWTLRRFLEPRTATLFRIPGALAAGEDMEDLFEDWVEDGFFLVFVNGRVGAVVACPDPEALEKRAGRVLKVLVDRLVRYNSAWRADERGRGLFFTRPRLDTVVVGRQGRARDALE